MAGPMVVKIGGALFDDADALGRFARAVAAAPAGEIVVVHGGGSITDRLLTALGVETPRVNGLRSTPDSAIDGVVGSLAGIANHRLVSVLRSAGAACVGLTLSDGSMCRVERARVEHADLGRVGRVTDANGELLRVLLAAGYLPVVSSIGDDGEGGALNVNADDAAVGVASACGAEGLVLLTNVPGVLDEAGAPMSRLDAEETHRLIETGVIGGGMIPKVNGALAAAQQLGAPVTIASWRNAGDLACALGRPGSARGVGVGTRFEPSRFNAGESMDRSGAMR